jgi:tetratricopeptide (TPR) repeat protein
VEFLGPLWALARARGFDFALLLWLSRIPIFTGVFGDFANWSESEANARLAVAVARILIWFIIFMMFYTDIEAAHPAAALAALGDGVWAMAGYRMGFLGWGAAGLNGFFDVILVLWSGVTTLSRWQAKKRQFVSLDRDVRSAPEVYKRGHRYAHQGKWALAVIHFRKAVALNPHAPQTYKDLALAQARLGRYEKALDALKDGSERAPTDDEFTRLIEALQAKTAEVRG